MKDTEIIPKITLQSDVSFHVCVVLMVGLVLWTFCRSPFALEDINAEAMDVPLTVGHMLIAREKGISIKEYMGNAPCWENLKTEDSNGAYAYWNKSFQFYYMAHCAPLLTALFVPFSRCFGVNKESVTLFSTCFSLITFVIIFYIAQIAYGRWYAVVTIFFMLSSLSWLIHVKVAYGVWMVSVTLICAIILCLCLYIMHGWRSAFSISAIFMGLLLLAGWISLVFGALMIAAGMLFARKRSVVKLFHDGVLAGVITISVVLLCVTAYSFYFRCEITEVYKGIWQSLIGRFSQGGIPSMHMNMYEQMKFAFRSVFVDMRSFDHLDKCLEGRPSISWFFTFCFFVGIYYAVKRFSLGDKLVLGWLLIVFGFLLTIFTFANRYALMAIPAMALLAARGFVDMVKQLLDSKYRRILLPVIPILVICLFSAIGMTQRQFCVDYLFRKLPDFEIDRMRGHSSFATWLKQRYQPDTTLVILGDTIMFPHTCFMFNTFGYPYNFKYWSNYVVVFKDVTYMQNWEQTLSKEWKKIIYVFSPCLLGDPKTGKFWNDWRFFLSAYPNVRPVFQYSYAGRQPSMIAFEINR